MQKNVIFSFSFSCDFANKFNKVDVSKKNLGRLDGEGGGENGGCASVCS